MSIELPLGCTEEWVGLRVYWTSMRNGAVVKQPLLAQSPHNSQCPPDRVIREGGICVQSVRTLVTANEEVVGHAHIQPR